MTSHEAPSEIGSDFPSLAPAMLEDNSQPPWDRGGEKTAYTETGRQALTIVRNVLDRRGVNQILVPAYLCESMVEPFRGGGWRIGLLETSRELALRRGGADWTSSRDSRRRTAILLASYFGFSPDEEHIALAEEARSDGAYVIEDETHRSFAPGGVEADLRFGSLRKLLPLADGAYVQGDDEVLAEIEVLDQAEGERWIAMDLKRDAAAAVECRAAMIAANQRLETTDRPFRASERTLASLRRLPYELFARRRRENAQVLRAGLARLRISPLRTSEAPVPSHLVIAVEDPQSMQKRLASERIYCPIHWPRVPDLGAGVVWRSDLLSLPVDHRYGSADMGRIVAVLEEAAV